MSAAMSDSAIIFEKHATADGRSIALLSLNAEKSLNALTLDMVDQLTLLLREWEADANIACVLLRGAGDKAFCAGGDVVRLHQSALHADGHAQEFFTREYRLDYLIHTYRKPLLVWGHGIVMGGGLGLMAGASHRVATLQTRMAMPEITIGLYPDVGGSWFLNRMPGRVGLFLALTGAAINAADAVFVGLADHVLPHEQLPAVLQALRALSWPGDSAACKRQLSRVLTELAVSPADMPASPARAQFDTIQALTAAADLAGQVAAITSYAGDDVWLAKAAATLKAGCPTSIRLVPEILARARHLSLREVFQLELGVSTQCVRLGNFQEGVRALLIDKDKQPRYAQASLAAVTDAFIAQHFTPPWGEARHPLADL